MSNLDIASLPPVGATPSFGTPPARGDSVKPADSLAAPDKAADKGAAKEERGFFDRIWGKEGFSFGALLDVINPLQHIPIVGTVYRAITGDSIGPASRIAGGTLFGGVIGLIASSIDSLVEEETGREFGQHLLAMKSDADQPSDPTTPTGRPEREPVLYAGDFLPRPDPTTVAPATMLAEAAPANAPVTPIVVAQATAPQVAAAQVQTRTAPTTTRALPVNAPVHEAANGAGGSAVPLATAVTRGRIGSALPTPQTLAGDPALLRQMQTTRAQSNPSQAQPRNAGSLDTTIRAATTPGVSPTFLDYTPKNAALRSADTATQNPIATPVDAAPAAAATPAPQAQKIDAGGFPQVPADLISRMNMALEKYQSMQRVTDRPAVNVTQ